MFQFDSAGRVAQITLMRPEARNAIPLDQWVPLAAMLAEVGRSDARVLIVRSAVPNIFSAGADLVDLAGLSDDRAARRAFREAMAAAIETLAALPIATIAAIDGGCYGAAVALAMACDIRIAGELAAFAITPAKIGILYPATDVARLKALVGPGQAARLLYSGMTIDAAQAAGIGLVDQLAVAADAAAMELAGMIAANAPSSISGLKRIWAGDPAADAMFDDAFGGADFIEGIAAFRARRPAEFER